MSLSELLRWGSRKGEPTPAATPKPAAARSGETVISSKAFPKFLSALTNQPAPAAVIDFGPVIGANVAFLGERLGCKLFIEDLTNELKRNLKY
jgi:hypothetical protein